jgi:hypothetical protein
MRGGNDSSSELGGESFCNVDITFTSSLEGSVLVPGVTVADLNQETVTFFKEKSIRINRIDESSRNDTRAIIS